MFLKGIVKSEGGPGWIDRIRIFTKERKTAGFSFLGESFKIHER